MLTVFPSRGECYALSVIYLNFVVFPRLIFGLFFFTSEFCDRHVEQTLLGEMGRNQENTYVGNPP